MIAVVADDLTGAVEIAGIGLRYGLKVEIVTTIDQTTTAGLLVVATDTRSMGEADAVKTMADITDRLKKLNPEFLFKKVDSVLRGHVIAELRSHLKQLGLDKALLAPTNPALNRKIIKGKYYIDGLPIHLSSFANDPDFSITGAEIHTMLRCDKNDIAVKTTEDVLPAKGITIACCETETDLKKWAAKTDKETLLAGGSGFFAAILESLEHLPQLIDHTSPIQKPILFVSGTTFDKSMQAIKHLKNAGGAVSYMPQRIVSSATPSENLFDNWADEVITLLKLHNNAVIAVAEIAIGAINLREKTAILVEKVFKRIEVKELLIEGGATASAIIKQLNLTQFTPVQEFSTGVVRMKAILRDDLFLTLKPGSYSWPSQVWDK
nr:four-carbon acid sugar kinase family protein [uncultured Mucilaginibacter sp.]